MFENLQTSHLIALLVYAAFEMWLGKTSLVKPNSFLDLLLAAFVFSIKKMIAGKTK